MENKNIDDLFKFVGEDNIYWHPYNEWGAWKFSASVPFSKLQKFVDICNGLFDFNGVVPVSIQDNHIYIDLSDYAGSYYDDIEKMIEDKENR